MSVTCHNSNFINLNFQPLQQLPESLMQRLSEVKERADIAAKEAAAAEAAVQAVQQVGREHEYFNVSMPNKKIITCSVVHAQHVCVLMPCLVWLAGLQC